MDPMIPMDAIFSTHLGRYKPRPAASAAIVLRSSPDDDQDSMIAKLRQQFPLQCKAIVAPITNIHQWFDHYDTYRHGYAFLHSVLATIAFQNSMEVHDFVNRWRNENRERFYAVGHNSGVTFTKAEIMEHGSGFLAEAAQQIHYLRASLQYEPSRMTDPLRDRSFVSYLGRRGGSVANNASGQSRYNPPIQPFTMNSPPTSQRAQIWNSMTSGNQMPNYNPDLTFNPIPIHISTQVPIREPSPHVSSRRINFHSDPEQYAYRPPIVPSQGAPGLFPYNRIPLSARRFPQPRYPLVETVPADPSPPRVFSNDARVLERQEFRSRYENPDNRNSLATDQQPLQCPSQLHQESAVPQRLTYSTSTSRVDSSLKIDPAVVFVGNKVSNGNYQSHILPIQQVDHVRNGSEQDPSGPSRDHPPFRQLSNSSTIVTWDENDQASANPLIAVDNGQTFMAHNDSSSSISGQLLNDPPDQPQGWSAQIVIPNQEQLHFSRSRHWPVTTHRTGRNLAPDHDEYRLFVSGLPVDLSESSLRGLFDPGSRIVDVSNIKTKQPRDSHGYAFVTFEKATDAALAVKALDSATPSCLGGRRLLVKYAFQRKITPDSRRSEAALRDNALKNAMSKRPLIVSSDDVPDNHTDQTRKPDYDALVGGNSGELSKPGIAKESHDKASSQFSHPMNTNEQRTPGKGSVSSSRSGHSKKRSIQKTQLGSSATELSLDNKTETNNKAKHEAKSTKNGTVNASCLENRGAAIDADDTQRLPGLNPEQFPPLSVSHPTDLSKPPAAQLSTAVETYRESHVKPTRKEAHRKENEPLASKLDKLCREKPQVKPIEEEAKEKMNESPASISDQFDRKQESNPTEMTRAEKASTAQRDSETASSLMTEPTSGADPELYVRGSNEAQVSVNQLAVIDAFPTQNPPTSTEIGRSHPVVELGSSDNGRLEASAADGKVHVARTRNFSSPTVALPMNRPSASDVVAETQAKVPENDSPVSISPQKSVVHDSTSSPDNPSMVVSHIQSGEDELRVIPTKMSAPSILKASPVTPSTASGQISSAVSKNEPKTLESHRPEVPLRTSSLQTPSTPILTHKKKQKVFTPVKVDIKDLSGEIVDSPLKDSTDLNPISTFEQKKADRQVEKSNISESQGSMKNLNLDENHEEMANLQKAALPPTIPGEVSQSKEQEDTAQHSATSAAMPPKKVKRKSAGRKQKSKSKACNPSSVVGQPSCDQTAVDSRLETPQSMKNLPEPETPYLVENQFILPQVTIGKSSQATNEENPQAMENSDPHFPRTATTCRQALQDQERRRAAVRLKAIRLKATQDRETEKIDSCDNIDDYVRLKERTYEPFAVYLQNKAPFSSIYSSNPVTREIPSEDIEPLARSTGYPEPSGIAQPLAWIDQGSPKLRALSHIDESHSLLMLDSRKSLFESALYESESIHEKSKARTNSSLSSDIDIVILGTPDDSDRLPDCNLKGADKGGCEFILEGVEGRRSFAEKLLKEEVTQASDLPFDQRYSNLDSSPGESTMTLSVSCSTPPSPLPLLSTAGGNSPEDFDLQKAEVAALLPKQATADNIESCASSNISSAASTIVHDQYLDSMSPMHGDLILDLAAKTPIPSTPKARQRKWHQRESSRSVSSSSTFGATASTTSSSFGSLHHLSEAFSAISACSAARYPAKSKTTRSRASTSPLGTPTHRPHLSHAAATLPPTNGSPPITGSEVIRVGDPIVGGQAAPFLGSNNEWKTVSGASFEDQAFVSLQDRLQSGPSITSQFKKKKNSGKGDPWRVPSDELVWGIVSDDGSEYSSWMGSRSESAKGCGSGTHKSL